jgi:uncharacterized protein YndB with AHSA1/START domain
MNTIEKTTITVDVLINAPVEKVWNHFTDPVHIVKWNNASDDWHSPRAENDLREGGRFNSRMEAKDGSAGFDFTGTYNKIELHKLIEYTLDDGRTVQVRFEQVNNQTHVVETFQAEQTFSTDFQREGWQSILNSFKKHVEASGISGKMYFEQHIDADIETVYNTMIDQKFYSEWTSAFNPASRYRGTWEKGSKIVFIGEDQQGNQGGMVSRIRENIPNSYISIEHMGILEGDKEILSGQKVEKWAGALENYSFTDLNGKTLVKVDMDSNDEYKGYFEETWPKALIRLKEVCEARKRHF